MKELGHFIAIILTLATYGMYRPSDFVYLCVEQDPECADLILVPWFGNYCLAGSQWTTVSWEGVASLWPIFTRKVAA
jgi:hypothetical protein